MKILIKVIWMDMLIGGKHISSDDLEDVKNPYNGDVIDSVPIAHLQTADLAIKKANEAKNHYRKCLHLKFQINYSM